MQFRFRRRERIVGGVPVGAGGALAHLSVVPRLVLTALLLPGVREVKLAIGLAGRWSETPAGAACLGYLLN